MFNYYKDVVLNSLNGVKLVKMVDAFDLANPVKDGLSIERNGQYMLSKIPFVYMAEGHDAKRCVLRIDVNKLAEKMACDGIDGETHDVIHKGLYQLHIGIKMPPARTLAEYANANWYTFGKPFIIGFKVEEDATKEDVQKSLVDAINVVVGNESILSGGQMIMDVKVEGDCIDLIAKDDYAYMKESDVVFERYDPTMCDSCLGEYVPLKGYKEAFTVCALDANGEVSVDEKHVEPFATADWIVENLRFPSYENIRYASPNEDERPIPGTIYNQFSFDLVTDRHLGGLSAASQKVQSRTHHVFFVPVSMSDDFKKFFEDNGVTVHQPDADKAGLLMQKPIGVNTEDLTV